ncbi:AAA family ATPase [Sedimentibacter sp. MB31-C6]|uniref:AAA family ATPase n=1 Tax=Sedimentibacter sp. MB31-C6 TaxID=3109366 RepID=UPI002DDD2485|nr:AAA family ATPase [Sedimentibacter sp. MB36-C1]WSI03515.1 AAA family ATPase [Sedimentibacter sp. MB36-C1]
MIPIKLTFQAFGPYVNKQEIDFGKFTNTGVFLIHGNTGSGKTTILDAISYALYGKASGGQRGDITAMRCQMAPEDIPTEVEFEFEIRGRTYKFTRNIKIRTKRNGTKEYNVTQNAMFLDEEGIFIPFFENPRIRDVEQKSIEIIGLNHEQFIQVIMLPQGKFEKLLVAKSGEKEDIMVTLFNAEKWQEAAEWICNEARKMNRDIQGKKDNIIHLLKADNAETVEDLENQINELKNNIENSTKEKKETKEKLTKERANLEIQNEIFNIFAEKDKAEKELSKINSKESEINEIMIKLEKGKKAFNISQKYANMNNLQLQLKEMKSKLATEENNYKNCIDIIENIEKTMSELTEKEAYIEDLKESKIKSEGLKEVYSQITKSKVRAESEKKKYISLSSELKSKQLLYAESKERLQKYSDKINYIFNNYSLKLPILRENVEKLNSIEKKQNEFNLIKAEIKNIDTILDKFNKDADINFKNIETKKAEYENKYHHYLDQAAYIMGEGLSEGQKCPVCGSIHHPEKALKSKDDVDASLIKKLGIELDKLKEVNLEISNNIAKYTAEKSAKSERLKNMYEEIAQLISSFNGDIDKSIRNNLKIAEEENNKIDSLRKTEANLKDTTTKIDIEISELNIKLTEQSKLMEESLAIYNSLNSRKIKGIENEEDLNKKIDDLNKTINKYINTLKELTNKKSEADKALSSSKASLNYLRSDVKNKNNELQEIKLKFDVELKVNNFNDYEEFKLYLVDEDILDKWDKKIQSFIIEKGTVKNNLERLIKLTENKTKPNIDELKNIIIELDKKVTEWEKQIALCNDRNKRLEKIINIVNKEQEQLYEMMKKYDNYYNFGITLRGDTGISLRRYVLGVMLSSVTVEANRLLKNVHDGRFQLCRTLEGKGRSRKAGLDLEVFDAFSGEKRGVDSLSGGEKFLVSLSLSLGLSAVVQAQSGGISMDTMFIDEGFGSLDSSSIGDAMRVLSSVKGSKRLVGIISHVQNLKETIETSIIVEKGREGSKLQINV